MQKHIQISKDKLKFLLDSRIEHPIKTLRDIPMPSSLCNLEDIAKEIVLAMNQKKKIVLIGDYDVDGVVSSAIVKEFFDSIPYPLEVVIPNRFSDGYGLSVKILDRIEADLIITVDNGISAIEAAKVCKDRNIKLIITDHHTPLEELPEALICNPKLSPDFPQQEICGACVAWYMCAAIKSELNLNVNMTTFLDLLALAIVSDVMPLVGINRVLLKKGLEMIETSSRIPIQILKDRFKNRIDSELISFFFAPLLNCAGRLNDAKLSYEFLTSSNYSVSLRKFNELLLLNDDRKRIQNNVYIDARNSHINMDLDSSVIVSYNHDWHEGILGIVAAKLSEEFNKPSIVLTSSNEEGVIKGSMRGYFCMNILENCSDLLLGFGGHNNAAGLSLKLENLELLIDRLRDIDIAKPEISSNIIGSINFSELDSDFFNLLISYEPYGEGNTKPNFTTVAKITNIKHIGSNGGNSTCTLSNGGIVYNAIRFGEEISKELNDKEVECTFCYSFNYNGDLVLKLSSILEVA